MYLYSSFCETADQQYTQLTDEMQLTEILREITLDYVRLTGESYIQDDKKYFEILGE